MYEIAGEHIASNPLVIIPEIYQELAQTLVSIDEPVRQCYLIGKREVYQYDKASTLIFDVDEIIPAHSDTLPERLVGIMQIIHSDEQSPQDIASQLAPRVRGEVLVILLSQQPSAFCIGPEQLPQPAGLLVYRPVVSSQPLLAPAARLIKITANDLNWEDRKAPFTSNLPPQRVPATIHVATSQTYPTDHPIIITRASLKKEPDGPILVPSQAPIIQIRQLPPHIEGQPSQPMPISNDEVGEGERAAPATSSVRRIQLPFFPEPVRCAYRGHRFTQPTEICPVCGVAICRICRDEAGGCITVNCPNSLCRD